MATSTKHLKWDIEKAGEADTGGIPRDPYCYREFGVSFVSPSGSRGGRERRKATTGKVLPSKKHSGLREKMKRRVLGGGKLGDAREIYRSERGGSTHWEKPAGGNPFLLWKKPACD